MSTFEEYAGIPLSENRFAPLADLDEYDRPLLTSGEIILHFIHHVGRWAENSEMDYLDKAVAIQPESKKQEIVKKIQSSTITKLKDVWDVLGMIPETCATNWGDECEKEEECRTVRPTTRRRH